MRHRLWFTLMIFLAYTPQTQALGSAERADAALHGVPGFTVEAVVGGPEVRMLVTEADVEAEMVRVLTQAGIGTVAANASGAGDARLLLMFKSYSIEPVLPHEHDEPVQLFPVSVHLGVSRPVSVQSGDGNTVVRAQVWWTHVEGWALQRTMHSVACVAVRRVLGQFVEAYTAAQATGAPAPDGGHPEAESARAH